MGYYSNVCLVLSPKGYDCLTIKLENMESRDNRDLVINLLNDANTTKVYNGEHLFHWEFIKWYSRFPDVKALTELLQQLDINLYIFKIVSEDGDWDEYGVFASSFRPLFNFSIEYSDPNYISVGKLKIKDIMEIYGLKENQAISLLNKLNDKINTELLKCKHSIIQAYLLSNKV